MITIIVLFSFFINTGLKILNYCSLLHMKKAVKVYASFQVIPIFTKTIRVSLAQTEASVYWNHMLIQSSNLKYIKSWHHGHDHKAIQPE